MSPPTRRTPPDQGGARKIRTAPDRPRAYLTRVKFVEDLLDADLDGLARLLGGYIDDYGELKEFHCPSCQPRGWESVYGPAAVVVDDLRWRCALCKTTRTIWELRRLVVEDVDLLDRVLEAQVVAQ